MKMEEKHLSGPDNTRLEVILPRTDFFVFIFAYLIPVLHFVLFILQALIQDVYSELVEDACLGLCFEVHRAVKQGYFFLDETDQDSIKEFEIVDQPGVDIFGQVFNQWKNKECECPNCKRLIAASRFAPHLEKCLGMGRNSSRIANRRLATNNNISKSESDQEDNDDLNDNDWSYGAEKKAKKRRPDKNQNSPRRSKSLKHKNGELGTSVSLDPYKYNYNAGISYESLGPNEIRSLLTTQCGVISEHTKKMCTRSHRCPQHTDDQRRTIRLLLLGPSAPTLPDADVEGDSFDIPNGQALLSRLQWEDFPDVSPTDSASSKASTNYSDSKRPKKKKRLDVSLISGGGGVNMTGVSSSSCQSSISLSTKKKKPKTAAPSVSSIYDELN
ncbi:ataxin-7-like protein 3 isoform X1 [Gambusia affinis]|uniref:ataxin-7-like protein 3 isoform X1 n=1 Tax=Gambusia affinis TaxID=33528 RepID=UPI001CDC2673|nr:ataxin-7-like protein 3 isoform X1 [Gambusia affinis]XP_043955794.1 ataxin-7-like protein 3 isoform X1 [Gambusia affinis]